MVLTKAEICDYGWSAPDFELPGSDGQPHSLAEVRGANGTLVMFICNHCPYVKGVIDLLVAEARAVQAMGIGVIAVMPNDTGTYPQDGLGPMGELAAEKNFSFPFVIDETQEVARAYNAVCTPDFFGFNAELGLQYRGRLAEIKDAKAVPGARRDLYEAMKAVAETGAGPRDQTASMGCSIKWKEAA